MYTRNDLCDLAALDIDHFKTLWRRNNLPLAHSVQSRIRRTEGYTAIEVLTVAVGEALMCQVGGDRGLPTTVAMSIAACARDWVAKAFADTVGDDIWAGWVATRMGRLENDGKVTAGWCIGGPLASINSEIAKESCGDRAAIRVFIVNISEVVREVRRRANEAKIYFPASGNG